MSSVGLSNGHEPPYLHVLRQSWCSSGGASNISNLQIRGYFSKDTRSRYVPLHTSTWGRVHYLERFGVGTSRVQVPASEEAGLSQFLPFKVDYQENLPPMLRYGSRTRSRVVTVYINMSAKHTSSMNASCCLKAATELPGWPLINALQCSHFCMTFMPTNISCAKIPSFAKKVWPYWQKSKLFSSSIPQLFSFNILKKCTLFEMLKISLLTRSEQGIPGW